MDNFMRMDEFIWESGLSCFEPLGQAYLGACSRNEAQRSRWPSSGQGFLSTARRLVKGTKKAGQAARLFCALDQTLGQELYSLLFRLAACNPLGRANQ